jgi:hypothetical protein
MRPPTTGPDAFAMDLVALQRCLRRVKADKSRPQGERERLEGHLTEVIVILLKSSA